MPIFHKIWTREQVATEKKRVKAELDTLEKEKTTSEKLKAILAKIKTYEQAQLSDDLLKLYVYIMSALVHHERYGGLSSSEIKKLVIYAYEVLRIQKVAPINSTLSFLYAEIHLILSQIFRKSGKIWAAAWEHQVSVQYTRADPPGGPSLQAISKGIRALSIGHGNRAVQEFTRADSVQETRQQFEKARIGLVRSLRLTGQFAKADSLILETLSEKSLSDKFANELRWESFCLIASREQNLDPMLKSIQTGKSHFQAIYIAEAFLWTQALRERRWEDRLLKMRTLARKSELAPRSLGLFLKAVLVLEKCRDVEIPLINRVRSLGEILEKESSFSAIDRRLLFLLASARWLARSRLTDLAAITLCEYRALSQKLSDAQNHDILNLAGDMYNRPWFQDSSGQAVELTDSSTKKIS